MCFLCTDGSRTRIKCHILLYKKSIFVIVEKPETLLRTPITSPYIIVYIDANKLIVNIQKQLIETLNYYCSAQVYEGLLHNINSYIPN